MGPDYCRIVNASHGRRAYYCWAKLPFCSIRAAGEILFAPELFAAYRSRQRDSALTLWICITKDPELGHTPVYSTSRLPSPQKGKSSRFSGILLGSVGAVTLVALLAVPTFDSPLGYTTTAYAAADHGPPGFSDLVNRVKGAVVSVRVKIDETGKVSSGLPFPPGSPLYKFFFPNGNPQQVIIGEGSGFFISADGYIVTNNHVADHAQSVKSRPTTARFTRQR